MKKRWGHGQEDVFPVAQFEKLWGDMTALPEVPCALFVVPRRRGQQLKDPAQTRRLAPRRPRRLRGELGAVVVASPQSRYHAGDGGIVELKPMTLIALDQAGPELERLVREAHQGEEIILTIDNRPVARLVAIQSDQELKPRQAGSARGQILYMADDFDAPLLDFGDQGVVFQHPKYRRSLAGVLAGRAKRAFPTPEDLEAAIEEAWTAAAHNPASGDQEE